MGASEFGYSCFKTLFDIEQVEVVGVLTTPASFELKYERGTKQRRMQNTVYEKLLHDCFDLGLACHVIDRINSIDSVRKVKELAPELIFVSGWYHIIGLDIIQSAPKGVVGLHSSLLPQYRGSAPLVWQIINGEKKAGISLFYFDEGVDSGDIIAQAEAVIEEYDTIKTLYEKVGGQGLKLMREYLPLIASGTAPRIPQANLSDDDIWPQRTEEDGLIDWNKSAREITDFVRAQTKPYPGAFTIINGKKITIWDCKIVDLDNLPERAENG